MQKRHRTFIAINLPSELKKRLSNFEKKYYDVPARWTEIDNLHITVLFFGDLTDEELAEVCKITGEAAKNHSSFNVSLNKVAYGPTDKIPPRYIWAGGETTEELVNLKRDLENSLYEAIKFKIDKNVFTPHITLARIKEFEWRRIEPEERTEVKEEISLSFTVDSIEVMESELKKGGPQYTVIESHQLQ
jgi:2'-5' RNA ligase